MIKTKLKFREQYKELMRKGKSEDQKARVKNKRGFVCEVEDKLAVLSSSSL